MPEDEKKQDTAKELKEEKPKTVNMPKSDMDLLLAQVRDLQRQVGDMKGGVVDIERTQDHELNLREWEGKLVVNVTKSWNERDKRTSEEVPMIGIYLQGAEEPVSVKLVDFMNKTKMVMVKLKETRVIDPGVQVNGSVEVKNVKYDSYTTIGTGVRVPMKVTTPKVVHDVIFDDGTEMTIPDEAVN